jgi:hypothetical protein
LATRPKRGLKASEIDRACKVDVIVSSGRSVAELINIELQARAWQITTSFFLCPEKCMCKQYQGTYGGTLIRSGLS